MSIIQISLIILEIFIIIEDKGKEDLNGVMERFMMVNGLMEKNREVAYGKDLIVYLT